MPQAEQYILDSGFMYLPCRNCGHPGRCHADRLWDGKLHMISCACGCANYRKPRLAWLRRLLNWVGEVGSLCSI